MGLKGARAPRATSDTAWCVAEREAAKLTVPELAAAVGVAESLVAAIEAGQDAPPAWFRERVRNLALARVEDLAQSAVQEARRRLTAHPDLVPALALVDPGTLATAMAEAERRRRAGEDVGYEAVLGEWASRPR